MEQSRAVLLVVDGSVDYSPSMLEGECGPVPLDPARVIGVVNKADLAPARRDPRVLLAEAGIDVISVSARTGEGLEELCGRLRARLLAEHEDPPDSEPVPNDRECALLVAAGEELAALASDLAAGVPPDLLGVRLETACAYLDGITGEITPGAILDAVFDGFCIGK